MRTKRATWFLFGPLALLGLFTTGLLVFGILWVTLRIELYHRTAATLPAERRSAQQAGLLLGPQDLIRSPSVPDADNAAPLYLRIDQNSSFR